MKRNRYLFLDVDGTFSPYNLGSISGFRVDHLPRPWHIDYDDQDYFDVFNALTKGKVTIDCKVVCTGLPVEFSSRNADAVQILVESGVKLYWLSTWLRDMIQELERITKVKGSSKFLRMEEEDDYSKWGKLCQALSGIKTPSKVVWADDDLATPKRLSELEKTFPQHEFHILKPNAKMGITDTQMDKIMEFLI